MFEPFVHSVLQSHLRVKVRPKMKKGWKINEGMPAKALIINDFVAWPINGVRHLDCTLFKKFHLYMMRAICLGVPEMMDLAPGTDFHNTVIC
jgi:hypothetical protein